MSPELESELAAAVVGILVTICWRIIDRYLPDPNRPSPPGSTAPPPSVRPGG
jgi:hypothetical protein